jgi:hypothetical protein
VEIPVYEPATTSRSTYGFVNTPQFEQPAVPPSVPEVGGIEAELRRRSCSPHRWVLVLHHPSECASSGAA